MSSFHPPTHPFKTGTLAQVQNTIPLGMGGQVVLVSHRRIKIDGPFGVGPPLRVKVSHLEGKTYDPESNLIKAYSNEVSALSSPPTPPPAQGGLDGWVGGWVGGWWVGWVGWVGG